jgi:hypothetical protein
MLNRLKRIYNPLASLDYNWVSTPSPHYDGDWGPRAADLAREGFRLKSVTAIQALIASRSLEKSFVRKQVEKALDLELAWCRMALADTIRWGICCGLESEDIQRIASTIPFVPVSAMGKEQLFGELIARFLNKQEDPAQALAAVLQLHAVLSPSVDITTLEQIAIAIHGHTMHKLSLSAGLEVIGVTVFAGLAFSVRSGIVALAAMAPTHLSAKVIAGGLALGASRFITKGIAGIVAKSAGTAYALLAVRAKLRGVDGLEPFTGLRQPGRTPIPSVSRHTPR